MPTAMATAITPCPAAGGRAADLSLFPRRLAQTQPEACTEPVPSWVGKLASHPQAAQRAPGTVGRARRCQKQVESRDCKLLELGGKEQSCGFSAGSSLHPCKGFACTVTTRQRCLKINQPKADQECSSGEGIGWMQEDEMFKRFESKPKTRSKGQALHGVKTSQASPDDFRLLKETVG